MSIRFIFSAALATVCSIGASASASDIGAPGCRKHSVPSFQPMVIIRPEVPARLDPELSALVRFEFNNKCDGSLGADLPKRQEPEVIVEVPIVNAAALGGLISTIMPQFTWR